MGKTIEDGTTIDENAIKKALFAHQPGKYAMSDDTGIFINALGGQPGVLSARWAGEKATTDEITQHTLKQMEGKTDRSATFRSAVALIDPDGDIHIFHGESRGTLLEFAKVKAQPDMPYSPIFVPEGRTMVYAEMTPEAANEISHRGKAFAKAFRFLVSQQNSH